MEPIGLDIFDRPATPHVLDFRHLRPAYYARDERGLMRVVTRDGYIFSDGALSLVPDPTAGDSGNRGSRMGGTLSSSSKQQRARARRKLRTGERLLDETFAELYKPLDDWDAEELARGRPRNADGNFAGRPPKYLTRELHERAMEKFKTLIRTEMSTQSLTALKTIQMVLESEEVDNRGKPIVSPTAKMDAAKFLLEHIVGKPVQPTQTDISVKLQGILGTVMVNPQEVDGQYTPAHMGTRGLPAGGIIDADVVDDDEEYEDDE